MTIANFTSDARYYELKEKYKKKEIVSQEEDELTILAAERKIRKYISDPNGNPELIGLHLSTVLAHPLFKKVENVSIGDKTYQRCYLAAAKDCSKSNDNETFLTPDTPRKFATKKEANATIYYDFKKPITRWVSPIKAIRRTREK